MEREKFVDESWKEAAALEKEKLVVEAAGKSPQKKAQPEADKAPGEESAQEPAAEASPQLEEHFLNYISGLAYQAMIFLGEIPHPATNLPEKNLEQAKFLIDTLLLLREKTKGNLSKRETDVLNASAYELQMKFVELAQKEGTI